MDKKTALLYAQMPEYKYLVQRTVTFIKWALLRVKTPYLACSFGKDSAVMLHLVFNQLPTIPVVFVSRIETTLIDNYDEIKQAWIDKWHIDLREISYRGWLEKDSDGKGIANATKDLDGFDSFFVGLRKDESVGRRISLKTHGKFFKLKEGKVRISPMADWATRDIATYMLTNDLPILDKYKRDGFEARTTAAIPSKFPHGSLSALKERDIIAYNKLLKLLPDAKFYT